MVLTICLSILNPLSPQNDRPHRRNLYLTPKPYLDGTDNLGPDIALHTSYTIYSLLFTEDLLEKHAIYTNNYGATNPLDPTCL